MKEKLITFIKNFFFPPFSEIDFLSLVYTILLLIGFAILSHSHEIINNLFQINKLFTDVLANTSESELLEIIIGLVVIAWGGFLLIRFLVFLAASPARMTFEQKRIVAPTFYFVLMMLAFFDHFTFIARQNAQPDFINQLNGYIVDYVTAYSSISLVLMLIFIKTGEVKYLPITLHQTDKDAREINVRYHNHDILTTQVTDEQHTGESLILMIGATPVVLLLLLQIESPPRAVIVTYFLITHLIIIFKVLFDKNPIPNPLSSPWD